MINQKLQDFEEEVKPIGNVVTEATLDVYSTVAQRFLPTPAKIHYLFNLRDISKVKLHLTLPPGQAQPPWRYSPLLKVSPGVREHPTPPKSPHPGMPLQLKLLDGTLFPPSIPPATPLSQVFQGMLRANKDFHDTKSSITRLWIHECFR